GAFDDVFTIDGDGNTQFTPNVSVFDLAAFLPSLADGTINVTVDPAGGTRKDSIAIDYAELVVHTTPIPLPASSLLLLAGLGGLAAMRRRNLG
ncbi:MAG: VPLPA-CTERM sorting domain-containing protein, partial [Pseudomonadota bacterium]